MLLRLLSATALVVATVALPAMAQTNEPSGRTAPTQATAPANPHPPYLVSQTEHLLLIFEADENALKSLLPPGIKPAAGNTVGLNMYRAQQVVGLVPYTASYLWINVDGFDSPDGTKGRWMAEGWYAPEPVPTVAKTQMGFPVQLGATRLERTGNRLHAVLNRDGADLIDATITVKEGNPAPASTTLMYPVWGPNITAPGQPTLPGVAVNRIPVVGEATPATPVSVEFHFSNNDAAKAIHPKRLLDALYFKGTAFALGFVEPGPQEAGASTGATASK